MSQESNQVLTEQITRARNQAHIRLSRYSRLAPGECQEAYLFENDQFCGLRFSLGHFRADWLITSPTLQLYRGNTEIGQVELDSSSVKRAA